MEIVEHPVSEPWEGLLAEPAGGGGAGVLVLAGSSGRIETERCRVHYEQSLRLRPEAARAAAIPIERSAAHLVVVAGGDDRMWPSLPFARELTARRAASGHPTRLITSPDAGHRPRFPGEGPAGPSERFRYGGTAESDAALGAKAWPHVLAALGPGSRAAVLEP